MAFLFMNETDVIGVIMNSGSNNVTGSMLASLFFVLLFLIVMAFMFGIPLEFLAVIILPFCIACVTVYGNFWLPIVAIVMFIGSIIAKNWLFK